MATLTSSSNSSSTASTKNYTIFLNNVKKVLQLGADVSELPGREKETQLLYDFFTTHIASRTVGSIYISGSPGTGKTAVVTKIIEKVKSWVSESKKKPKDKLPMPHIIFLNGVTVAGQGNSAIFHEVYRQYTGDYDNNVKDPIGLLEKKLLPKRRNKNTRPIFIIIDEIDALFSKSSTHLISAQSPLYRLFEWPARANSICTIVGIANSVDLIQRLLPMLRRKKLEPTSIVFEPYNKNQITNILLSRLNIAIKNHHDNSHNEMLEYDSDNKNKQPQKKKRKVDKRSKDDERKTGSNSKMDIPFDERGLELVARSIAAHSGDARKALDVLRQSIVRAVQQKELQEAKERMKNKDSSSSMNSNQNNNQNVRLSHVSKAIKTSFGSRHINSIRALPREAAIVLIAGVIRMKTSKKVMSILEYYSNYSKLKRSVRMQPVSMPVYMQLISHLEQMSLVATAKGGGHGRNKKIRLNVVYDDVQFALENETFYNKLLETNI
jgi:cell division control protein 6